MSREEILDRIKRSKPSIVPLPEIDLNKFKVETNLLNDFITNLESTGGKAIQLKDRNEIISNIKKLFPDAKEFISAVEGIELSTMDISRITSAKELDKLDIAILEGQFGVAENGAVWLSDKNFQHRSIPFICANLIIILDKNKIFENMHEALLLLKNFNERYGVFISGPSKTADIEQSLVIGAQGPLSLTIFLI